MEEHKINDQQFAQFVNGQLNHKGLLAIEKELINTGEAIAALQASIVNYRSRYTEAEEILGSDEIFFKRKAINGKDGYSIVSESINSNNMTLNFNKQEIARINDILEKLNHTVSKNERFADALIEFYLKQCPGTTPSEAKNIINGLREGIVQFNASLSKNISNDTEVDYVIMIKEATKDMSLQDRYNFMINYFVALQTVSADNYDADLNQIENFSSLIGKSYQATEEVTEDMIDEMSAKIAEFMKNSILILPNTSALETLINNLQDVESAIKKFALNSKEDIEQKLKMAVATYIPYRHNEISSIANEDILPESIGVGVAAAMEEEKVFEEVRAGNKSIDLAIKAIKIIGGIALFTGFVITGALLLSNVVTISSVALTSIFGTSILGVILSCGVALTLIGFPLAKGYGEVTSSIFNAADKLYDKLTQEYTPNTLNWTIMKIRQFTVWFTELNKKGAITNIDDETSSDQVIIQ